MTEQQPEILTEETNLPQDHTTGDILPGISLPPKETPASYLLDFLEILVAAVSVTLLLFTLFFPSLPRRWKFHAKHIEKSRSSHHLQSF
jgi:hypothetical protein